LRHFSKGEYRQQERLYPFGSEERSLISRILTDSAGASENIISAAQSRICGGCWGEGRFSCPRVLLSRDNTPPVAPVACIQVNTKRIVQRQLCWGATSNTTGVQLQIPGSPVVVAAASTGMVVLRDSVSDHPGSKGKGDTLQQEMGAAIQEKQKGRVTHCKDPLLTAKMRGSKRFL